ncbi:Agamous-like MADS-box protein AGL18 [Quillaja saponaria]|uniref:Agamous-like MADS-box protein AGL18 n=1 Tax=Quillaja saponaria TaxID=32244 RepID=A0AAD7VE00_QUISA|nr:Agamous-like MADS-box protein AGL18 [Quillaja saponaria]
MNEKCHLICPSMEHALSRYSRGLELDYAENPADEQPTDTEHMQPDINMLKDEFTRLQLAYLQMMGKELDGLSLKELQLLEDQLSEGLLSVKDKKEQVLLDQIQTSRLQEQKAMMENEALHKQLEEIQRAAKSPFLEFNPLERKFSLTGSKAISVSTSEENDHSDTSLQLGLSAAYSRKRKAPKIEPCNDSGSQVASE